MRVLTARPEAGNQGHVDDVAEPVMAGMAAGGPVGDLDRGDVGGRADHCLADQEPGRELDVIVGRAHRHRQRGAVDPDAEWLLARQQVSAPGDCWRKRARSGAARGCCIGRP